MAGWIKMRKGLWEFPRVVAMALRLRVSADAVVGKLFRLWCWADTYATDERVPHVTAAWVNAHVELSGFAEAMVAVGWLETTPTGVRFVNFAQHNWEDGKKKALTANRVEKHRGGSNADVTHEALPEALPKRYPPIPTPLPSEEDPPNPPKGGKSSADKTGKAKTGKAKTGKAKTEAPIVCPPGLDTEAFRAAFARWVAYRKEARKALKPSTVELQLKKLAAWGEARAIAAIDHSITSGYQGLFDAPAAQAARPANSADANARVLALLFADDLPRGQESHQTGQDARGGRKATPGSAGAAKGQEGQP